MGLKCCGLASGSEGNCIYIESKETRVLIDAGLSYSRVKAALGQINIHPQQIDAVIITHEHSDHVKGAGIFARRERCPLYLSRHTLESGRLRLSGAEEITLIESNRVFQIKDLRFEPFSVLHDAADPIGMAITNYDRKIGIATDLGRVTHLVREKLRGCHLLILEFNHDEQMLMTNENYPWHVKQRIKSSRGHLSNADAGRFLGELADESLQAVMLAHLSRENNLDRLARQQVDQVLVRKGMHGRKIIALQQDRQSELIEV
jgi:phosphoribosyl 1,2-cyclic phosphodiesterase